MIRIALPRWSMRRWVLTAVVVVVVGGVAVYAGPARWPPEWAPEVPNTPLSSKDFNGKMGQVSDNLNELDARLKALEGEPACPRGYVQDKQVNEFTVCKGDGAVHPAADEMVKVGTGASAFWIDRFEASVWDKADGTGGPNGGPYGVARDDLPGTFGKNGQWTVVKYAVSRRG